MFRIGTAMFLALTVSGLAQARVPVASAEAMLEQTVRLQLDTYRGMLGAITRDGVGQGQDEVYTAHLDAAEALIDEAQSLHQAGDNEEAVVQLTQAWRELSPAAKVWMGRASQGQKKTVMRTMVSNTSERLTLMRSYRKDLPTAAAEAVDRAQAAHSEALRLRAEDPRAAMASEKTAIQALNRSFGLMWQDYEGEAAKSPSAPAARKR